MSLAINLLQNPNFEEGMTGWTINEPGPEDTPKTVSDVKYEGNNSMYFVAEPTGQASISSGFMPVTPGRRLKISGYFKGENVAYITSSWHRFNLVGVWYDSAKRDMELGHFDLTPPLGTYSWIKKEVTKEVPAGAAYYKIRSLGCYASGTGKGWADKLEVVMLPESICSWITDLGGWEAITSMNALDLLKARIGTIHSEFTVTSVHRLGVLSYRRNDSVNGDLWTGCTKP